LDFAVLKEVHYKGAKPQGIEVGAFKASLL
jgi:hypothetical protein